MPFFKTTKNIFVDFGEYFDPNWMDSDKLVLPPQKEWDYARELQKEDIDLWEVIWEGAWKIYAAWSPYAEFYLIMPPYDSGLDIETYYGKNALNKVIKKMEELRIPFSLKPYWVDPEDMWLFNN